MNINFTFHAKYKVMWKKIWCNAIGFGKWGRGSALGIWVVSRGKKKIQARFSVKVGWKKRVDFSPAKHILNFNPQRFSWTQVQIEQGHLDHPLPVRLREYLRRMGRSKGGCSVMLSSGPSLAVASVISQQTQAPATKKPREGGVINFSCVVTGETTRLH